MGLYLVPAAVPNLAYSRCPINAHSRNTVLMASESPCCWFLCDHLQKSGIKVLTPTASLCPLQECPNSLNSILVLLNSLNCYPNKFLAAGPVYKTDKQEESG